MRAAREPFYRLLGATIAASRVRGGMSQQQLGDLLTPRVTRACVANIESGKQRVLVHTLVQIAEALGMAPSELLPGR
jgi:transcriptional regulator with XRE-family HTH domain